MILAKVTFVLLIIGPVFWGLINLTKYKKALFKGNSTHFKVLINSGVLYAIAFNLIFFLQELFLVLGKKALGLKAYLFHNNHSWDGVHEKTALMQGAGALAILVIGILGLIVFYMIRNSNSSLKLFFLWFSFQGLLQSVLQLIVVVFEPRSDVGQTLVSYYLIDLSVLELLSFAGMVSTVIISICFSRYLLAFAPPEINLDDSVAKLRFIRFIAVGSALLGFVFIIPFRVPPINQIISPILLIIISIPWIWSAASWVKPRHSFSNKLNDKINAGPILTLIAMLLLFRFVLAPGIAF